MFQVRHLIAGIVSAVIVLSPFQYAYASETEPEEIMITEESEEVVEEIPETLANQEEEQTDAGADEPAELPGLIEDCDEEITFEAGAYEEGAHNGIRTELSPDTEVCGVDGEFDIYAHAWAYLVDKSDYVKMNATIQVDKPGLCLMSGEAGDPTAEEAWKNSTSPSVFTAGTTDEYRPYIEVPRYHCKGGLNDIEFRLRAYAFIPGTYTVTLNCETVWGGTKDSYSTKRIIVVENTGESYYAHALKLEPCTGNVENPEEIAYVYQWASVPYTIYNENGDAVREGMIGKDPVLLYGLQEGDYRFVIEHKDSKIYYYLDKNFHYGKTAGEESVKIPITRQSLEYTLSIVADENSEVSVPVPFKIYNKDTGEVIKEESLGSEPVKYTCIKKGTYCLVADYVDENRHIYSPEEVLIRILPNGLDQDTEKVVKVPLTVKNIQPETNPNQGSEGPGGTLPSTRYKNALILKATGLGGRQVTCSLVNEKTRSVHNIVITDGENKIVGLSSGTYIINAEYSDDTSRIHIHNYRVEYDRDLDTSQIFEIPFRIQKWKGTLKLQIPGFMGIMVPYKLSNSKGNTVKEFTFADGIYEIEFLPAGTYYLNADYYDEKEGVGFSVMNQEIVWNSSKADEPVQVELGLVRGVSETAPAHTGEDGADDEQSGEESSPKAEGADTGDKKPSGQTADTVSPKTDTKITDNASNTPVRKVSKPAKKASVKISASGLKKKKLSIKKGKKKKLKAVVTGISGKVKWSSSNKKIVSVSKKGVIRAKRKGKAYITAKVGKVKYRIKVVVK